MNFNNGGTCVYWRISDVLLVFRLNLLVIKMTACSAYLWMSTEWENSFGFAENLGKIIGRIEIVASIELLKIILQLMKISPSFSLDDGFDLDDDFQTASCRTLF